MIATLRQMFPDCAIGFSDHSPGWAMDVAALTLGAALIEKTITLERTRRAPEHIMSLEPQEMRAFVETIRAVEGAMGRPRRSMGPDELERRQRARRSAFLAEEAKKGQWLQSLAIIWRRPGCGIAPPDYEKLTDARLIHDLPAGHMINQTDLEFK